MKTIKKVEVIPIFCEFIPSRSEMKQGEIYISKKYAISCHLCLCGCGEESAMPLNEDGSIDGWSLIKNNNKVSFAPSIGNFSFKCKSHYIITNNIANFV